MGLADAKLYEPYHRAFTDAGFTLLIFDYRGFDARVPTSVPLAAAQGILEYRPIDAAPRVRGLMVIAVAEDAMTPTDHAEELYEAAPAPKRLVMQRNTTHYAAYKQYGPQVIPLMVDWL